MTVTVYEALADPVRRRVLELLAEKDRAAGEVAAEFEISRPAVSRHLRVLRDSGLVRSRGDAQRRVYSLEPRTLEELEDWLDSIHRFWAGRLDRLEQELERRKEERT